MSKKLVSIALCFALLVLMSPLYSFAYNKEETLPVHEPNGGFDIVVPSESLVGDTHPDIIPDYPSNPDDTGNPADDISEDTHPSDPADPGGTESPEDTVENGEPQDGIADAENPELTQDFESFEDSEHEYELEETEETEETETGENLANPEIFRLTLPTKEALDFVLDPKGLSEIAEDDVVTLEGLNGGKIFPRIPEPATVLNESSFAILVTIELRAASHPGGGENTDKANFVPFESDFETTKKSVFAGEGHNVLIYAVPSADLIRTPHDAFEPDGIGYVITEEAIKLEYILPAAEYELAGEGDDMEWRLVPGTGSGIQFKIGGFVNDSADWQNFTKRHVGDAPSTIGLSASFSYAVLYEEQADDIEHFENGEYSEDEEYIENGGTAESDEYAEFEEISNNDGTYPENEYSDFAQIPTFSSIMQSVVPSLPDCVFLDQDALASLRRATALKN